MRGGNDPRSMTGFDEARAEREGLALWLSLRCVNHRFLDLHIHLPEGWEGQELLVRRIVREQIRRGRVDLKLNATTSAQSAIELNHELAGTYLKMLENLRAEFKIQTEPDLVQLLRLPGVVNPVAPSPGPEYDGEQWVEQFLEGALERLNRMRVAEGRVLSDNLRLHLQRMMELTENAERLAGQATPLFAQRLESRLKELLGSEGFDSTRLAQEAALAAVRTDATEELTRLRSHTKQFAAILEGGGEVGKKLDFLLQEMNREANTLLSKISGAETENLEMTRVGLEVKSEIEKLREQVQNLE